MANLYLEVFDQIRYMAGMLIAVMMFTINTVPKRAKFRLKSILGFVLCLILSTGILLIQNCKLIPAVGIITIFALWYVLMSFLAIGYIMFCFEIAICNAIFRCIFGLVLQQIVTIIFKLLFVGMIYPEFPNNYPVLYMINLVCFYFVIYRLFYKFFVKRVKKHDGLTVPEDKATFIANMIIILVFSCVFDLISVVLQWIIPKISVYVELTLLSKLLSYFCILLELLFCVILFIIQFDAYKNKKLQREKALVIQMATEKRKQYRLSKENIDIIKQKAHDLKYQMLALEAASEEERKKMIAEIKDAVMIHNGILETNNEVLNIILTEKNLYCLRHNIRFSNMVYTTEVDFINVIDLYTMIGNALDNSIECVNHFQNDDKKTINFSIDKVGQFLSIITENYYEGELLMKDGLPVTLKDDKTYHGIGLKSIKMLANRYNGDIRVSTEDDVFTLQILIPFPESYKK